VSSVQSYERILQDLRDIRVQIEERIRPVAQHAVQAEVERLLGLFEQRKNRLRECFAEIDRDLLDCRNHLTEYRQIQAELALANERFRSLGAPPLSLPEFPSPDTLMAMIVRRLQTPRAEEG
jgi:hypothetical protein